MFWLVAATLVGAVLSAVAALTTRSSDLRKRRMAFAFALPFGLAAWACPAGLLAVGWGALTGLNVQFGSEDTWQQELPNGYSLVLEDGETGASVHSPAQTRLVANVDRVAVAANKIYGTDGYEGFVLDSESGDVESGPVPRIFERRSLDPAKLVPAAQYPGRARTRLDDLVFWAILLGPPLFVGRYAWIVLVRDDAHPDSETPTVSPVAD